MLTYNTGKPRLILPEYGRNIQQMVDHCLTIEDRDERTRCAHTIVAAMLKLFPKIKEQENYQQKLWDHLAIMSGFRLDIDAPVEMISSDPHDSKPERVPYSGHHIRFRHYGKDIELMIARIIAMPEGQERDELTLLVANHMKKLLLTVSKDGVEDDKIFRDLADYSHGEIRLDPQTTHLHDFQIIAPVAQGKKKKKKH